MSLFAIISVLFAALGLLQYHDYILNGHRAEMFIPYFLPSTGTRLSGPFGQPNFHATVMLIGLCALGYLYKFNLQKFQKVWVRLGFSLTVVLLFFNFFLTNSRAGQVSLIFIFLGLYLYGRYCSRTKGVTLLTRKEIAALALLTVFSFVLYWLTISHLLPQGQQAVLIRDSSIFNRLNMWVATLLMAWDHPWLGVGPDNFKAYLAEYQIRAHALTNLLYEDLLYTRWAHNEYLQVLAEGGIFAFAAMMAFLITAGRRIWQGLKETATPGFVFVPLALVPLLVHGGFEWPLRFAPLFATFLLLIALSLPNDGKHIRVNIDTPVRRGFIVLVCCFFIGLGSWALYWDIQAGILKSRTGNEEMLTENVALLKRLSENPVTAVTMLRQGIHPYLQYAVRENDADLAQELSEIMEGVIYLEGASWQWYNLARLQLTAGREGAAMASVERAIHLRPNHEPSWQLLRYLNVLNASRETGRPVEDFYPDAHFEGLDVGTLHH